MGNYNLCERLTLKCSIAVTRKAWLLYYWPTSRVLSSLKHFGQSRYSHVPTKADIVSNTDPSTSASVNNIFYFLPEITINVIFKR